ncbi:MBL fold metallo-hydrolase [Halonotius sp. F2-221B]|uniref:MBL fold metallo-hydrolase n=1 Tax=Halonotius sp. F2-221B TaxID=2731620 RepID=UPI00398AEEC5
MDVQFLGGAGEVGRSAILVNDRLLLDYGVKTATPMQYPVGDVEPEAVVVSHGHLDHAGAVPTLLSGNSRPEVHWTPPTAALTRILARDTLKLHGGTMGCPFTETHVARLGEVEQRHGYRESFEAAGHEITFYNAGHIPGSAHVLVDDGETRLLYTADFHTDDTRLLSGSTARPPADVVLCESTYANVDHEPRAAVEERFAETTRTTLWEGGTVVVPAFAIGRTQELLMVCAAHDLDCYVDGMGVEVLAMLRQYPDFLRDSDALDRAARHARKVTGRDGQRKRIADQNTVIVTTSGMLSGGPAMTYIPEIRTDPTNRISLTGYQVEGTPGRELLETGRCELNGGVRPVAARTELFDFSAHADDAGLRSFLASYDDARVLVNHGDDCEGFAAELREDGVDASAPEVGDERVVE